MRYYIRHTLDKFATVQDSDLKIALYVALRQETAPSRSTRCTVVFENIKISLDESGDPSVETADDIAKSRSRAGLPVRRNSPLSLVFNTLFELNSDFTILENAIRFVREQYSAMLYLQSYVSGHEAEKYATLWDAGTWETTMDGDRARAEREPRPQERRRRACALNARKNSARPISAQLKRHDISRRLDFKKFELRDWIVFKHFEVGSLKLG